VLLAIDGRKGVAPGRPPGRDILRWIGGEITICHVVMRPTTSASNETDGAAADAEETSILQDLRANAIAELGPRGKSAPIRILHGDPGQRICEFAEFVGADLIVLGPRVRGGFARALRGSVSRYVVTNARMAVLVLGDSGADAEPHHGPTGGGRADWRIRA
jgi:nucleotide-binding universal stress UspA family protein